MGIISTKKRPGVPTTENQGVESKSTPEIHGTQQTSDNLLDVAQTTAQAHCVEELQWQPSQERDGALTLAPSDGVEGQRPQESSQEGSETQSLAGAYGSLDGTYGSLEEDGIAPEHLNCIEELMAETEAPCVRTDYLCERCQECMLGESFGDSSDSSTSALEYGLYASLMSEPWISPQLSQILLPPVEMLDSLDTIKEVRGWEGLGEAPQDAPAVGVAGAQVGSLPTQQPSGNVHSVSDAAPPMMPADKEAEADAGTTEDAGAAGIQTR